MTNDDIDQQEKDLEQKPVNDETPDKQSLKKEVFSWIRMFAIVIIVVLVLTRCIIINARVPSGSMENTIMTHDRLIGFRFSYWFDEPERGDIILFSYPIDEKQTFIKRVIGLPGETVTIKDSKIYINNSKKSLSEPYLKEKWTLYNDGYTFHVPANSYLVLGDNRNNSLDGRLWAQEAIRLGLATTETSAEKYSFVRADEIKGKAIFTYYKSFRLLDDVHYS